MSAPLLLAPAGDPASFLAALSAGADAIYLGLKHFSARMAAKNFSISELARLTELAHSRGVQVHVALNTLVKPSEIDAAGRLIDRLQRYVSPDCLIFSDLAVGRIARELGFKGDMCLSTLAAVSPVAALRTAAEQGVNRVVLAREFNVDEIRSLAEACPPGMTLESFVHGALCHNVSGRCYWSSYLGGRSGLRGRCAQPCRRVFNRKGMPGRYFSCQDLRLDALTKVLLTIPQVTAWKIEGRKKGPHYVFHTVAAYKLLRDHPEDPKARKQAEDYLDMALGRPGTNYLFLPQRPKNPVDPKEHTGSGRQVGKLMRAGLGRYYVSPREPLIPGDLLRVGFEDEPGHSVVKITRPCPKSGRYDIRFDPARMSGKPKPGALIFLIDRREPGLVNRLNEMDKALDKIPEKESGPSEYAYPLKKRARKISLGDRVNLDVWRMPNLERIRGEFGAWMSANRAHNLPLSRAKLAWWWLPPIIWPSEESEWRDLLEVVFKRGGRKFVLGAPWQKGLFPSSIKNLSLWAGPFCNISNAAAIDELADMGFAGTFLSPEMSGEDMIELAQHSSLPTGVVTRGLWTLGVSRTLANEVKTGDALSSPKGEVCFATRYGSNIWIFPNWGIDIESKSRELMAAGVSVFAHMREPTPKNLPPSERTSIFNWDVGLL